MEAGAAAGEEQDNGGEEAQDGGSEGSPGGRTVGGNDIGAGVVDLAPDDGEGYEVGDEHHSNYQESDEGAEGCQKTPYESGSKSQEERDEG